jgi:hypothetical protein
MYILYSREYKCVFITFSRCWSKTLIKWVCAMNGVTGAKTHAQATNDPKLSLRYPGEFKKTIDNSYSIYIMVRRPYERFLSSVLAHGGPVLKLTYAQVIDKLEEQKMPPLSTDAVVEIMRDRESQVQIIDFMQAPNTLEEIKLRHKIPFKIGGVKESTTEAGALPSDPPWNLTEKCYNIPLEEFKLSNKLRAIHPLPRINHFYSSEMEERIYSYFRKDFTQFGFNRLK